MGLPGCGGCKRGLAYRGCFGGSRSVTLWALGFSQVGWASLTVGWARWLNFPAQLNLEAQHLVEGLLKQGQVALHVFQYG